MASDARRQFGAAVAPRHVAAEERASRLAKRVPQLSSPTYDRTYRHVQDWLRIEYLGEDGPRPHWEHSYDSETDSEYSSDEDEYTSDEDAPVDEDYWCYQCPYHPTRRHPSAELCCCWDNMSPAERKRWCRRADCDV